MLHERRRLEFGCTAKCARCGAVLYRRPKDSLQRALTLTIAAAILFAIANTYPFLYFKIQGRVEINTMITGVIRLHEWGMMPLAAVIGLASILAPGLKLTLMLYVLLPLHFDRVPPGLARAMHWLKMIGPWGMLEVYMLGVLIAIVNLTALASIMLGTAFYAFIALFLVSTAASAVLDPEQVWQKLERAR